MQAVPPNHLFVISYTVSSSNIHSLPQGMIGLFVMCHLTEQYEMAIHLEF